MVEDFKKVLVLMAKVIAVNYTIFNNFMADSFIKFIAISLAIFLGLYLKLKRVIIYLSDKNRKLVLTMK